MISPEKLIRVRAPKPRELPKVGTGALYDEQQVCYEIGYEEGIAAPRKAQREALKREEEEPDNCTECPHLDEDFDCRLSECPYEVYKG